MKKLIIAALLLAPVTVFAQKFGHFNSADIIQAMPEYKTLKRSCKPSASSIRKNCRPCRTNTTAR